MNKSLSQLEETAWFKRFHKSSTDTAAAHNALKVAYQLQTPYSNVAIVVKKKIDDKLVWVVVGDFYTELNLMVFDDDSDESKEEAIQYCKSLGWPSIRVDENVYELKITNPADFYKARSGNYVEI